MESKRVPLWVWMILAVLHLVALNWALATQGWRFPDTDRYLQAAANLSEYGVLYAREWTGKPPQGKDIQEFTIRSIGYPLLVEWLAKGGRPVAALCLQNTLSLLSLGVVLSWWGKRAWPNRYQWGKAVMLICTFPAQFIYASSLMSETLLQAVVVAVAMLGLIFLRTKAVWYFTGACIALVAALLIKPVFYPAALGAVLIGLGFAWTYKKPLLAVAGLLPALAVGGYMYWNLQRTGYFHFSSIAEINLLHYNAAGVMRQLAGPEEEYKWVDAVLREAENQPTFAMRQQRIHERATELLWAHPLVYGTQHMVGMATIFVDPGRFDIYQFMQLPPLKEGFLSQIRTGGVMQGLRELPIGLVAVLGIIGLANLLRLWLAVRGFRRLGSIGNYWRLGRWLPIGLLFYVALLTGPLGASRFLVPVWPLLLGLALVGVAPVKADETSSAA